MDNLKALKVVKLRQAFPDNRIVDIKGIVFTAVARCVEQSPLPRNARVAITAGSRGIRHITDILKYTVMALKSYGYEPFLISAMGSHGGGNHIGQAAVLDSLGITEQTLGAPVISSDRTIRLGTTSKQELAFPFEGLGIIEGLDVYIAQEAMEADAVLVVNRVKPHTAFHGKYESGLMKMLAVGLGRAPGADSVHRLGADLMAEAIPSIAGHILTHAPIWGGLAIVENGYDEPVHIVGLPADQFPEEESMLLKIAKGLMPSIPVNNIDLCLVAEMGKNFSGTGVDTNVVGRMKINGISEPAEPGIRYLAILGLSEPSHRNATGIGLADFTTQRVVNEIDWEATYLNCLTSGFTARAATPIVAKHDKDLLDKAMFALKTEHPEKLRLVILRNTLQLDELWVSETVYEEIKDRPDIKAISEPMPLMFDTAGSLQLLHNSQQGGSH